jgi:hypothetical protein
MDGYLSQDVNPNFSSLSSDKIISIYLMRDLQNLHAGNIGICVGVVRFGLEVLHLPS